MLDMDDKDAAAAVLYEGGKLQARLIPLRSRQNQFRQMVEIIKYSARESFPGRISRILGEADLQNTLQVKVSASTPTRTTPEMLCRAKFFGISSDNERILSLKFL